MLSTNHPQNELEREPKKTDASVSVLNNGEFGASEETAYKKRQEQFMDTLCHELRNPANGILGNVTLLETMIPNLEKMMKESDPLKLAETVKSSLPQQITELKEIASAMGKCIKYQKGLLDDCLHISKLESGKVKLEETESDIKSILQNVIRMFSAEMNQKGLQLLTIFPPIDLHVKVDTDRLSQILVNLLSNSIKFTPTNGKITLGFKPLKIEQGETELEFTVEDNGIGMSPGEQSRLFNRFAQVGRHTSQYESTGLGLVICKSLVTLMKGKIEIDSEKSKGTKCRFTIICPTVKPVSKPVETNKDDKSACNSKNHSPIASESKLNILVVEDNIINQRVLVKLFERSGHACKVANNGKEAVEMVAHGSSTHRIPFDAILMDIEMPIMNGLEATVEIRAIKKKLTNSSHSVPIIAISGYSSGEYMQKAQVAGMNDFITKPYETDKIIPLIRKWIAQLSKNHSPAPSPTPSSPSKENGSMSPAQLLPPSSFLTSSSTSSTTTPSGNSEKVNSENGNGGPEKSQSVSIHPSEVTLPFSFFSPSTSHSFTISPKNDSQQHESCHS